MLKVRVTHELEELRRLWEAHWPSRCLFDLWPVRACFQARFDREPHVLTAFRGDSFQGMLALSRVEEEDVFGHFPGETWQGKTWLEQNRLLSSGSLTAAALLESAPAPSVIRYLVEPGRPGAASLQELDEVGYLFYPSKTGFRFENHLNSFSSKSRRKIRRELERLSAPGVAFRYDRPGDLELMFQLNLEGYGELSYFRDPRFLGAFEDLASVLHALGLLRVTTVLIGGRVAAVDMGAVWNSTYTVLAGGTHPDFPGVAKLINFHHLERACRERFSWVDFLCGDFNWKERFHLTPRPLYKLTRRLEVPDLQPWEPVHSLACGC